MDLIIFMVEHLQLKVLHRIRGIIKRNINLDYVTSKRALKYVIIVSITQIVYMYVILVLYLFTFLSFLIRYASREFMYLLTFSQMVPFHSISFHLQIHYNGLFVSIVDIHFYYVILYLFYQHSATIKYFMWSFVIIYLFVFLMHGYIF